MSPDYVKDTRTYLQRTGLLKNHERGSWEVTWPPECRPESDTPTDETAVQLAGILDAFILRKLKGVKSPLHGPSPRGSKHPFSRAAGGGQNTPSSGLEGGKEGVPSPPFSEKVEQPLPSPPFSEKEKKAEKGAFAREPDEKGAVRNEDGPGRAGFREMAEELRRVSQEKPSQPMAEKPRRSDQLTPIRDLLTGALTTAPAKSDDDDDADLRTPREAARARLWSKKNTTVAYPEGGTDE